MNRVDARRPGAAVVRALGAVLWCCCAAASAQTFPAKPIRAIVPFAAGGTSDLAARVVAEPMAQTLGRPLVIDNKPGAGGTLGTAVAAKEAADGYVIGLCSVSTHATSVSLYKDLKYDPRRDFVPIGMIAEVPNVLVVSAKLGVNSVAQLVARAKAEPGALNFGSIGNGTSQHVGGELFKLVTGTRITHVPYKQNAQLTGAPSHGRALPHVTADRRLAGCRRRAGTAARQRAYGLLDGRPLLAAQDHGVAVTPHKGGALDVMQAATLHFAAAAAFDIPVECQADLAQRIPRALHSDWKVGRSGFHVPATPGLGVEVDEVGLQEFIAS